MHYTKNWVTIDELGEGGQGKVWLVKKISKFGNDNNFSLKIETIFKKLGATVGSNEIIKEGFNDFRAAVQQIVNDDNPKNQFALKLLHDFQESEELEQAQARIRKEITAMAEIKHPNLINVVDFDLQEFWFVAEYYSKGKLSDCISDFKGMCLKH